jgi:hypothetical protein
MGSFRQHVPNPRRPFALALSFSLAAIGTTLACAKSHDGPIGYTETLPRTPERAPVPSTDSDAAKSPAKEGISAATAKPPRSKDCSALDHVSLFASPEIPTAQKPLRIIATSAEPFEGSLQFEGVKSEQRRGGPPYYWTLEIPAGQVTAGAKAATFDVAACGKSQRLDVTVAASGRGTGLYASKSMIWPNANAWSYRYEDLYAAWIELLFDAPDGESFNVPALHEIIRDPKRNFLFNHLGAEEDAAKAPSLKPDCADLPYVLRAYFAFKCKGMLSNVDAPDKPASTALKGFGAFVATTLADRVHSGSARTPFEDEGGDYYPVPITWNALRPGTVYADPYGHVLMVTKRTASHDGKSGVLYAVDGQPDGTVGRKRFWRGTFLYTLSPELGGPGFKRFRPVVATSSGAPHRMRNADIAGNPNYGDFSLAPGSYSPDAFYDAVDDALSPEAIDPKQALLEVIAALEEQVRTRIVSVENGRKFLQTSKLAAPMPEGAQIFETDGPWEDFSTPSRDLRLLIALDVVKDFPARVIRRLNRFAVASDVKPDALLKTLSETLEKELSARSIDYTRTDGSVFKLSLADVLGRIAEFEMTYNPNDCVEIRWGAKEGSDERSTCKSRASAEQQKQMQTARTWFHERKRPPRK